MRFFGESDEDACERLRREEKERGAAGYVEEDSAERSRLAMERVDADIERVEAEDRADDAEEEKEERRMEAAKKSRLDVEVPDAGDRTYADLFDKVGKINKGDIELDMRVIADFMLVMLRMWGEELNGREEEEKAGVKGRQETIQYTQTR